MNHTLRAAPSNSTTLCLYFPFILTLSLSLWNISDLYASLQRMNSPLQTHLFQNTNETASTSKHHMAKRWEPQDPKIVCSIPLQGYIKSQIPKDRLSWNPFLPPEMTCIRMGKRKLDEYMIIRQMQKVGDTNWCGRTKDHFFPPSWLKNDGVQKNRISRQKRGKIEQ